MEVSCNICESLEQWNWLEPNESVYSSKTARIFLYSIRRSTYPSSATKPRPRPWLFTDTFHSLFCQSELPCFPGQLSIELRKHQLTENTPISTQASDDSMQIAYEESLPTLYRITLKLLSDTIWCFLSQVLARICCPLNLLRKTNNKYQFSWFIFIIDVVFT